MILSIDLASHKTGYALFTDTGELEEHGLFILEGENAERYKDLFDKLSFYLECNPLVNQIVLEGFTVQSNFGLRSPTILCTLHGVLYGLCWSKGLEIKKYKSKEWRDLVNIYGDGPKNIKRDEIKQRAVALANKQFGTEFQYFKRDTKNNVSDDDIAEAVLLGWAYFLERGEF